MISRAITADYSIGDSVLLRPLFLGRVHAGYPSHADDEVDYELDLNRHIFKHPETTMMVWMRGDGFEDDGVFDGDLLIADSSLESQEGSLVVVLVNHEQVIKKVTRRGSVFYLVDGGGPSEMLELNNNPDVTVLAVVTFTIHTFPD